MNASKQIDKQIARLSGWRGRTMARLRNVISEADSKLTEGFKWNTAVWSANGNVCALGAFKDHIKINFFTKGRYCRTLTICSIADLRQRRHGQSISTRAMP
jgi:hypothetical protein